MTVVLIIIGTCAPLFLSAAWLNQRINGERARQHRIGNGARAAADAVDTEHKRARRAMNVAAGQAWRNLTE